MMASTRRSTPRSSTADIDGALIEGTILHRRAASIRSAAVEDSIVLLDLDRASYSLLNPSAATIWRALRRPTDRDGLVRAVHAVVGDDLAEVNAEVGRFLEDGRARGIVATGPAPAAAAVRRPPAGAFRWLHVKAALAIARTRLEVRLRRFERIYAALSAYREAPPLREASALARAERAFLAAETLFPAPYRPNDCLPRSIALFRFLRSVGLPARHRIGVRHTPLMMHAWVECDGAVVLDDRQVGAMAVLAELG